MSYQIFKLPKAVALDTSANVYPGAKLRFFLTNSSTPTDVYTTSARNVAHAVPVEADSAGVFPPIFLDPEIAYKATYTTSADSLIYTVDPVNDQLLTQESIGGLLYPQTDVEVTEGVTPTFEIYAPSPKIDVRRHLSAWDDASVQTSGLQTAINMAYAQKGRLILPNGLNVTSGALSLTMSGNRTNQALAIEGPGFNGAKITQTGSPTALLKIAGATPSSDPSEAPLILEGFTLQGVGKTAIGLQLNGVAYWRLSNVQCLDFTTGMHLKSALVGSISECMSNSNNYGLLAERDGASPYPAGGSGVNRVSIKDSVLNLNSTYAISLASGINWELSGLDLESNGTLLNASTGCIILTTGLDEDIGYAQVAIKNCWFEGNKGRPLSADCANLILSIQDCLMLDTSANDNKEILITLANRVSIRDTMAPASDSVWDFTVSYLTLENTIVGVLTDSGATNKNYRGASTVTANYVNGRKDSYTGTLTGCTTSPTVTIQTIEDGDDITVRFDAALTATSNTTACTVTGMPANIRPSAQRTVFLRVADSTTSAMAVGVVETNGTLTLSKDMNGAVFTNSGTKGVQPGQFSFRR